MAEPKSRRVQRVGNRSPGPLLAPVIHGQGVEQTVATHEALKSSPFWVNLRLDGYGSADDGQILENRRCPQCGSTLSKLVPVASALSVLHDASAVITRSLSAFNLRRTASRSSV